MSTTSHPITPEFFLQAIRDLELEQLHTEAARLQLSLYHLRRSQIALEEFRDDPVCISAIEDNKVVIRNQEDRIDLIRLEVERRGFSMEHDAHARERLVNGNTDTGSEEGLGRGVIMGGMEDEERGVAGGEPTTEDTAALRSAVEGMEVVEEEQEQEGIYL